MKSPEMIANEIIGVMDGMACPVHGTEFITLSDGDGHPASWHDFCSHEDHEDQTEDEIPELIMAGEYIRWKVADAITSERMRAERLREKLEQINKVSQRDGSLPTQYDAADIAIVRVLSAQALAAFTQEDGGK